MQKLRMSARNAWSNNVKKFIANGNVQNAQTMAEILARMAKHGVMGNLDHDWTYEAVFVFNPDGSGVWWNAPGSEGLQRPRGMKNWQPRQPKGWQHTKPIIKIDKPFIVK